MSSTSSMSSHSSAESEASDIAALPTTIPELQALHTKMSKKIAQLTKVIVVLNTKTDEVELDKQRLIESFNQQFTQADEQMQAKIEAMAIKLTDIERTERDRYNQAINQVEKQASNDRESLESQYKAIQSSIESSNQTAMKQQQSQILELKSQIESIKQSTQSKLSSFNRVTRELESRLQSEVQSERDKREAEVKNIQSSSEERIKQLMKDKITLEATIEQLKNDQSVNLARQSAEAAMKAELAAQKLAYEQQLRDKDRDKQVIEEQLINQSKERKQLLAKLDQLTSDTDEERKRLNDQISALKNELSNNQSNWTKLDAERDLLISQARSEIERLNQSIKQSNADLDQERQRASLLGSDADQARADLAKKLSECEQALSKANQTIAQLNQTIVDLQRSLAESQQSLTHSQEALDEANQTIKSQHSTIQSQTAELEQIRSKQSSSAEHQQSILDQLNDQIIALNKQFKDTIIQSNSQTEQYLSDKQASEARQLELERQLADVTEQLRQVRETIDRLMNEAQQAAEIHQRELADAVEAMKRDAATRGASEDSVRLALEAQIDELRSELDQAATHAQTREATLTDKFNRCETALKEVQDKLKFSLSEFSNMRTQYETLMAEYTLCQSELEPLKDSHAQLYALTEKQRDMEAKLKSEMTTRIHIEQQFAALTHSSSSSIARLTDENHSLQRSLNEVKQQLFDKSHQLDTAQEFHAAELSKLQAEHEEKMQSLTKQLEADKAAHAKALVDGRTAAAASLQAMQARSDAAKAEFEKQKAELIADMNNQLEAQKASYEQQLADMQNKLREEAQARDRDKQHFAQAKRDEAAARLTCESEFNTLMQSQRDAQASHLRQVEGDWQNRLRSANSAISTLQSQLTAEIDARKAADDESKRMLMRAADEAKTARQAHEQAIINMENDYKQRIANLEQAHSTAHAEWQAASAQSLKEWQDKEAALLAIQAKLQHRIDRREARREDVLRIRELEEFGARERKLRIKAEDDAKLFQLELINREESYNKMFNRSPVVGNLMNSNGFGINHSPSFNQRLNETNVQPYHLSNNHSNSKSAIKPPFLSSLASTVVMPVKATPQIAITQSMSEKSSHQTNSSPSGQSHPVNQTNSPTLPQVHSGRRWTRTDSSSSDSAFDPEEKRQMKSADNSRESSTVLTPRIGQKQR